MPQGFPEGPGVEGDGCWGLGTEGSVPGETRGAAGIPGSLSRCPAPAPGRCTRPKPALAPRVTGEGGTGSEGPPATWFPLPVFPDEEEEGNPGPWGPEGMPGLQFPTAFGLQLPGTPASIKELPA